MWLPQKSPSRLWSLTSGVLLATIVVIASGLLIAHFRLRVMTDATNELETLAIVLAEQTDRSLQAVEVVQTGLMEKIDSLGVRSEQDFRTVLSSERVHTILVDWARGLTHVDALNLIDARGRMINFSRSWPVPSIDVSDRDFFVALKSDPRANIFVSKPVTSRGTGTWTIYLARRVSGPDGEFLGLILGAMRQDYFEDLYRSIATLPHRAIALTRRDGIRLARYPTLNPAIGHSVFQPQTDLRPVFDDTGNTVRPTNVASGDERLVATRALQNYPVVVSVSDTIAMVLRPWLEEALYILCFASLLIGAIIMAIILSMRELRNHVVMANAAGFMARHDVLTLLPNRVLLREHLEESLQHGTFGGGGFALLCLDLDRFKLVNDTLGHPTGDALLKKVAERLRACIRQSDLVARLGSDEFAIIQHGSNRAIATALAGTVLATIGAPYDLDGRKATIGATIGLVLSPRDSVDPDELLRMADLALYSAKSKTQNSFCWFEPEMDAELQAQRALELDLRGALAGQELELFYQPVTNLRSGRVIGFEALMRWRHPVRGLIPPLTFIPIAEATGQIGLIGEWAVREACREAAGWGGAMTVAVNLSAVQFQSHDIAAIVADALQDAGLSGDRLELEITESVLLLDQDSVRSVLHRLRDLGVRIALDDFGTGYSSLSYLTSFPFDRIKIDRSFVKDMETSRCSATIVRAVVNLAASLGVATTAEGVETSAQLERLRADGCTDVQGYLVSPPLPAREIIDRFIRTPRIFDAA